jgi:hypothetical protein
MKMAFERGERSFLIIFLVVLVLCLACVRRVKAEQPSEISTSLAPSLIRLRMLYPELPFLIEVPPSQTPNVRYEPVQLKDVPVLLDYLKLFAEEIAKYPQRFFSNRDIRAIGFVKKFFFAGKPVEGLYESRHKIMLFNFNRNRHHPVPQRHNIHHEIYHMMALQIPDYKVNYDAVWMSYNVTGFVYGVEQPAGKNVLNPMAPAIPGFISVYAMTSIEEDKAEIFAGLMMESQHRLMQRWSQKDEYLRKKMEYMKSFVQTYCPAMDAGYWQKLLAEGN